MARLLTIDNVTVALRNALLAALRPGDEAILLPQADQSIESGVFKNVVFQLDGQASGLSSSVFSPDWFCGVSLLKIRPNDVPTVQKIVDDPAQRCAFFKELREFQSELFDSSVEVGPPLACDENDRDLENSTWHAGFDSSASFVGLFSAEHSKIPEGGSSGNKRVFKEFYLACRAGGGIAASTFHARLQAGLASGASLDALLEDDVKPPGSQGLRRVASASARNRRRLLFDAAKALGISDFPDVGDPQSRNKFRSAVPDVEVSCNTLRKLDVDGASRWQYSAAVDGLASKGLASLSNAADGILLFCESGNNLKIILKNRMWQAIPFNTKRIATSRELSDVALQRRREGRPHFDDEWIKKHFTWQNRKFEDNQYDFIPFSLCSSHDNEAYAQKFSRELGLADLQAIRLRPELVCVAGVPPGKLRALVKARS